MNVYTQWKKYLENNKPSAHDMAVYAIARSINSQEPLSKSLYLLYSGFTPIKKTKKILNGAAPYSALTLIVGDNYTHKHYLEYRHRAIRNRLKEIFEIGRAHV